MYPVKIIKITSIFIVFFLYNSISYASPFTPVFGVGGGEKGKKLIELQLEDGSKSSVRSHTGVHYFAGLKTQVTQFFEIQTTLGYKVSRTYRTVSGDAKYSRFPLEAIALTKYQHHRLGVGISHLFSQKISCKVDNMCDFKAQVYDTTGYLLEYQYMLDGIERADAFIGLRYSHIRYKFKDMPVSANANELGFVVGITL